MPAQEIVGPASSYYVSQRLKLHFADWGNEEKPPLLLVHGGRDHARSWDWVARALREDYHVIAPDLRGHGDSAWSIGGQYTVPEYVLDLDQLIEVLGLAPVRIVAHSLGAAVSLFYGGVFPDKLSKLVAVEGMGPPDEVRERFEGKEIWELTSQWIDVVRKGSRRQPRRYPSIDEAAARMQSENLHLSPEQARHLTVHGVARNEDGTFSWKFDNGARAFFPQRMPTGTMERLWERVACPTLLVHGSESWHGDPSRDGRASHLPDAAILELEEAGHWVHHDQLDLFLSAIREFLRD
ncbi:MAG: alpha/beta hydrolase [Deltaproteobacteria bacterium]|jgi:pimeloyl-ACP methyl ester carboxylesterase|nr:alpha/beta hydrolase [Deltaproteobacteria bacterium]